MIQCCHEIVKSKPDAELRNKANFDIACPVGNICDKKERKSIDMKCEFQEVMRLSSLKIVLLVLIVFASLQTISQNIEKYTKKMGLQNKGEDLLKTVLSGTARMLQKFLQIYGVLT